MFECHFPTQPALRVQSWKRPLVDSRGALLWEIPVISHQGECWLTLTFIRLVVASLWRCIGWRGSALDTLVYCFCVLDGRPIGRPRKLNTRYHDDAATSLTESSANQLAEDFGRSSVISINPQEGYTNFKCYPFEVAAFRSYHSCSGSTGESRCLMASPDSVCNGSL